MYDIIKPKVGTKSCIIGGLHNLIMVFTFYVQILAGSLFVKREKSTESIKQLKMARKSCII